MDERTENEIYYPPFEAAAKAGVGSVMCSFNKINGVYSCENNSTLHSDLKQRFGLKVTAMRRACACARAEVADSK